MEDWSGAVILTGNVASRSAFDRLRHSDGAVTAQLNELLPEDGSFYFSAPLTYLGNKITSYGGLLNYTILFTEGTAGSQFCRIEIPIPPSGMILSLVHRIQRERTGRHSHRRRFHALPLLSRAARFRRALKRPIGNQRTQLCASFRLPGHARERPGGAQRRQGPLHPRILHRSHPPGSILPSFHFHQLQEELMAELMAELIAEWMNPRW